jgi:hypothetical protein
MLLWQNDVAGKNNMFLGLHVKCPIFLSDIKQVPVLVAAGISQTSEHKVLGKKINKKTTSV